MKNSIATTYGALMNGDRVSICGHCFEVSQLTISEDHAWRYPNGYRTGPLSGPGRGVVRFTGTTADRSLANTSYNGGRYGAYVHIAIAKIVTQ